MRKRKVVGRTDGMKYRWKGHTDRNRHKNRTKRSGQARLVYAKNINRNIPTTCRWARGDSLCREARAVKRSPLESGLTGSESGFACFACCQEFHLSNLPSRSIQLLFSPKKMLFRQKVGYVTKMNQTSMWRDELRLPWCDCHVWPGVTFVKWLTTR